MVESERPQIFRYITERFGHDRTARVASFGTIKAKGVLDDVGRHLYIKWNEQHPGHEADNPWSIPKIANIKAQISPVDIQATKEQKPITDYPEFHEIMKQYPDMYYYFDGLYKTKISQSVHPAGMVISPISLDDNYGVFDKEGENCLMIDMDEAHDVGAAKYDFLALKTVKVIRDTCRYLGINYPRTHEINWNDEDVWADMRKDLTTIFQFEGQFAADCFKKFQTDSIFDMSLVTACIRPSGASYRNDLLSHKQHHNPSTVIDDLLSDNLGYLVYQEDTIKFLQQICGLSGSAADTVRRAIGKKKQKLVDAAMPMILDGYCKKSSAPREEAEQEAQEFLKIISDSANYQFG